MSELTEKTIGELLEYKFFIPSYQRGYRWTETQIEDLMSDIDAFMPTQIEKTNKKTWYCLQPVVIKECDGITKKKTNLQGTWYEVIDGQQRLTSIFLIIHYANEMWVGKQKIPEFQIKYETRDKSSGFLQKQEIIETEDEAIINFDNIDYHHISKAYNEIHKWVKNYKSKYNKNFDNNDFLSKLKSHSKVIWYEVTAEKDAIEIFTRINMGKIPLTNAELIKALFLNSSNFPNSDTEEIRLRQLEIASEWDRIEYSLQNDELWYFINNIENELPTRIEFLFNIIYSIAKDSCPETKYRDENQIKKEEEIKKRKEEGHLSFDEKYGTDKQSTFRYFAEKFKTKSKYEIDNNWKEIKIMFQTIEEWFTDRELYHKIGYLIASATEIIDLLKEVKDKQKQEFKKLLEVKIAKKIQCENLEMIEYGNGSVKKILLFHNIQTMLSNKNETSRFPFNRFKIEKWDIEHIHAIATDVKVKKENQKNWLENNFIKDEEHQDKEINKKIEGIKNNNRIDENDFKQIIEYVLGEPDNNIQNLCLLDRATNRSYKNDSFKEKRRKIIENEKRGSFIPICTKNVFMKYYSNELIDLELWNENRDRKPYLNSINETLRSNSSYRLNQIIVKCQNKKS